jgi:hypothetical protein
MVISSRVIISLLKVRERSCKRPQWAGWKLEQRDSALFQGGLENRANLREWKGLGSFGLDHQYSGSGEGFGKSWAKVMGHFAHI